MSTQFRSERALYVLEEWQYFDVLRYYPVAVDGLCDGTRAASEHIVTLYKGPGVVLDAHRVAKLHAHSLGDTEPRLEGVS